MAWLWMNGAIPSIIGEHTISLKPEREEATWHVMATAIVTRLIASVPGTFSQSILRNSKAGQVERLHISAKFEEIKGPLTLEAGYFRRSVGGHRSQGADGAGDAGSRPAAGDRFRLLASLRGGYAEGESPVRGGQAGNLRRH